MPQCSAVDLVYHLFDVYMYVSMLYIAIFVLFFFVLLCANKRVHYIRIIDVIYLFIYL